MYLICHVENEEEIRQHLGFIFFSLMGSVRQRLGDCLEDLGFEELLALEKDSNEAVYNIRDRKNLLTGSIPVWMFRLRLKGVYLSGNQFSGSVEFGESSAAFDSLEILDLALNSFSG
ncbi:probable LRR receptor-like serine/threonine-protein kinase IRK [Tanacetum coccineum]|uniref:Probable LRR receptor-like serine/threonine-protein kinase IRK n=1 Tax=Tanacetum coccineum TaxID=301880 RepID=A0ABQ5DFR4_9ASTR